ncbi:Uma2 family endonuclease [Rhodococcus sp. NPDC058514]|uniref:Uma2 family endonuclease n=1 Tax=unclassified Rhodococcus (in: high G+C Gram-positive bacteria) TaxID=192944 RepID=UPI003655EDFF
MSETTFPRDLLTIEQWDALEERAERHLELVEGVPIMTPSPRPLHQRIGMRLGRLLSDRLPDRLEVLHEVEIAIDLRFPPTVRVPDLVVVPAAVVDANPVRITASDVALAVEIVSPGSRRTDHVMKRYEYEQAGIPHFWIVDLDAAGDARFLALRLVDGRYEAQHVLHGDTVRVDEPVALEFAVSSLSSR